MRARLHALSSLAAGLVLTGTVAGTAPAAVAAPPARPVVSAVEECAAFATANVPEGDWACLGSGLTRSWSDSSGAHRTYTDVRSRRSVDVTGLPEAAAEAAVAALTSERPTSVPLTPRAARARPGTLTTKARIDDYHAKNTEYVYWKINGHAGKTNFSYSIGISNHSANVDMSYFETSGVGIKLTWRLRLRHDVNLGSDTTLFTYPDVHGPWYYTRSYSSREDRYGDGYNTMPYETGWKVFWDSYNLNFVYGGTSLRPLGTVQSDRATCYKTVSCKFL